MKKLVLLVDGDTPLAIPNIDGKKIVVIFATSKKLENDYNNKVTMRLSPFLDKDGASKFVTFLISYYPNNSKQLDKLLTSSNLYDKHMFAFIYTAINGITKPFQEYVRDEFNSYGMKTQKNLLIVAFLELYANKYHSVVDLSNIAICKGVLLTKRNNRTVYWHPCICQIVFQLNDAMDVTSEHNWLLQILLVMLVVQ